MERKFGKAPPSGEVVQLRALVILFAIPVIWALFHFASNGAVLTAGNLVNLFKYLTVVGILSTGMTLVITMGHIDLSVGSGLGMLGAVCAYMMYHWGMSFAGALFLGLILAMTMGGMHGLIVALFKVPSFIVTLSGLMAYMGIKQLLANPVIPITNEAYLWLGQGYLSTGTAYGISALATLWVAGNMVLKNRARKKFSLPLISFTSQMFWIGTTALLFFGFSALCAREQGVPVCVLLMLALAALLHFVMTKTRFGRYVVAVGSNAEAALFSGINISLHTVVVFVIMGVMVFFAGIVSTSQLMAGAPDIGDYQELYAIAACVIGGTSLKGGTGNVWMSLLGALLMASVVNGMEQVGIASTVQKIILGAILIAAVAGDQWARKRHKLAV